jgi:hypothetical protein
VGAAMGSVLSEALARELVPVAPPLNASAFLSSRDEYVERWLDDESTAAEHFAPEALLSAPPLCSGRTVDHPLGLPWLSDISLIKALRQENDTVLFALSRLEWRLKNWGFAVIEMADDSWAWCFPQTKRIMDLKGVFCTKLWGCCVGKAAPGLSWLLHNCPVLHRALHKDLCGCTPFVVSSANKGFESLYGSAMAYALKKFNKATLPICPSLRPSWVRSELLHATKRLAENNTSAEVADALCRMLLTMVPGQEVSHIKELIRFADHRGSEIRVGLWSGGGNDQLFPYPSFAWRWKTVQSYAWHHDQHINILEFTALFNYLRSLANKRHLQHMRLMHVFDSKVVCGVLGKGRSPSRRMNRCCRRLLPLLLGMDWYVMTLWTCSGWEYADAPSRLYTNDERC